MLGGRVAKPGVKKSAQGLNDLERATIVRKMITELGMSEELGRLPSVIRKTGFLGKDIARDRAL